MLVRCVAAVFVMVVICLSIVPTAAEEVEIAPVTPPTITPREIPPPLESTVPTEEPVTPPVDVFPTVPPEDFPIDIPPIARTITFTGNTVIPSDELLQISGMTPGQIVTERVIEDAVQNIEMAYQRLGYIAAVVDVDLPPLGTAGPVTFHIQELVISEVRIVGLERTDEFAIQRLLTIEPGEILSRGAIVRDFIRLQQLGIFEEIFFTLEPTVPGEADLVWTLVERERFNFVSLGGSYSPRDGFVGTAQLTFGNFRGRAERLNIVGSIGGIAGRLSGEVEYFSPWIAPRNTTLYASVFSTVRYRFGRDLIALPGADRYFERRTGLRTIVSRPVRPFLTGALGLRYESVDVSNLPVELLDDPAAQGGTLLLGNLRGTWDRRNSAIDPSTGTYTVGFVEAGTSRPDVGGRDAIAKSWVDRRWYFPARSVQFDPISGLPIRPVPVIALRASLAGSLGDLPFFEQYFVGGIADLPLRGYAESRFWGKYALVGNAELRWPLSRTLSGVLFLDVGDAWGSDFQFLPGAEPITDFPQHESFSPRFGAGVGIRYATPLGPLRLDFAYGDRFRTHFSFGQVF